MKKLSQLTKDERSLLLMLECAAVDYGGKVDTRRMNTDDMQIASKWTEEGFLTFERIRFHDIYNNRTHAVKLSENAWQLAHEERKARFNRIYEKKDWLTTSEQREITNS